MSIFCLSYLKFKTHEIDAITEESSEVIALSVEPREKVTKIYQKYLVKFINLKT